MLKIFSITCLKRNLTKFLFNIKTKKITPYIPEIECKLEKFNAIDNNMTKSDFGVLLKNINSAKNCEIMLKEVISTLVESDRKFNEEEGGDS